MNDFWQTTALCLNPEFAVGSTCVNIYDQDRDTLHTRHKEQVKKVPQCTMHDVTPNIPLDMMDQSDTGNTTRYNATTSTHDTTNTNISGTSANITADIVHRPVLDSGATVANAHKRISTQLQTTDTMSDGTQCDTTDGAYATPNIRPSGRPRRHCGPPVPYKDYATGEEM